MCLGSDLIETQSWQTITLPTYLVGKVVTISQDAQSYCLSASSLADEVDLRFVTHRVLTLWT
jgi:hypothetical protein